MPAQAAFVVPSGSVDYSLPPCWFGELEAGDPWGSLRILYHPTDAD